MPTMLDWEAEEQLKAETARECRPYFVSVYLVDRCFGGPQEGGWYYEAGVPSTVHAHMLKLRVLPTRSEAEVYGTELQAWLDNPARDCDEGNFNRRELSSVLSAGRFYVRVEDGLPAPFPREQPRYE